MYNFWCAAARGGGQNSGSSILPSRPILLYSGFETCTLDYISLDKEYGCVFVFRIQKILEDLSMVIRSMRKVECNAFVMWMV